MIWYRLKMYNGRIIGIDSTNSEVTRLNLTQNIKYYVDGSYYSDGFAFGIGSNTLVNGKLYLKNTADVFQLSFFICKVVFLQLEG